MYCERSKISRRKKIGDQWKSSRRCCRYFCYIVRGEKASLLEFFPFCFGDSTTLQCLCLAFFRRQIFHSAPLALRMLCTRFERADYNIRNRGENMEKIVWNRLYYTMNTEMPYFVPPAVVFQRTKKLRVMRTRVLRQTNLLLLSLN